MPQAGGLRRDRVAIAIVALILAALTFAMIPSVSQAVPIVPFTARFSTDDNGTVAVFGNNLLSCPTSDSRCVGARAGSPSINNNSFAMQNLDADDVASTFNSSAVVVSPPPNGEVLWAGLYWGARLSRANGGVAGVGDRKIMQLRTPGADYAPVRSQVGFGPTSGDQAYQEFANVTDIVRAAGAGTYWGANVVAGTGEDRYAGWSLVVVYRAPGLPLRSLTVFDGFADVGRDEPQTVNLSGFRTPVSGPVETQLGMVAYEGDYATGGDSARLNGTLLSTTPLTTGSNFFNGTNDDNGRSVQTRTPAHLNMLGYDVKNLGASGIPNGATSATISLESTGDRYFPGVVTTAIRLFAPDFTTSTKTVSNLAGRTPALPGDELEYTLTYPNTGQDPATNVTLTDSLPAGTTFVSATPSSGSCTSAGQDLSCTIGTIGVGATWQATVRVTVGADAAGTTLTNAAVLNYRAATLGRDLSYVVAPAVIDVETIADLSITKTLSPDPAFAGGEITSLLAVTNDGPNAASGVVVTDQLPSGTEFVSASTPQGSCAADEGVLTCNLGSIANGATVEVEVVVGVPSGSTATSVVNIASVSSPTADPDPSDNTAGGSAAVQRAANLAVTKTAAADSVVPGETTTFTVTTTNDGPSDATDVLVTDTVGDPNLLLIAAAAPGATCTVGESVAQCATPLLAPGASLVMTVEARVAPGAPAGLGLVDSASASASTPDDDPSDNTAQATITATEPQADISVAKTSTDVVAGGTVSYSVTVVNNGPSDATAVTLADPLPGGFTASSVVSSRGTCTLGATVSCDLGILPGPDASGNVSSASITIVADVPAGTVPGTIANTATAGSATTDPDAADNVATADTVVTAVADVSITKTATPVQPAAGEDVTFTMVVTNAGPSSARDVVLDDPLPAGLTPLDIAGDPGVACDGTATVSCDIGELAPGASTTVTVTMNVPSDFDLDAGAVNTATVASSTPDPANGNNTATATVTANAIADLIAFKWDTTDLPPPPGTPPRTFTAGEIVTYKLAVGNFGPSDAAGAQVIDILPPGVTYIDSVPECGFEPPNRVVCNLPPVPSQFAAIIPVRVQLDPDLPSGTLLSNSVEIILRDPDLIDPVSSNNFASVTNPVATTADLNVVKLTYSLDLPDQNFTVPSSAPSGTNSGYGLQIRNDGPSVARDVMVVDSSTMTDFYVNRVLLVKPGLEPIDLTAQCSWSGGDLQCPIGDVPVFAPADAAWFLQVDGLTLSSAQPGEYVNTATLTSPTPDSEVADNTSQAPITVLDPVATLTIDKSVLGGEDVDFDGVVDIVPGTTFGYQLSVENVLDLQREGASDAPGVVVTDTLPAGLIVTAATSTQGDCTITPPSTVTCDLGTVLGPGRLPQPPAVVITVSGTVAPTLTTGTSLTNTATVSSPVSADATDSVTQRVVAVADVAVTKVADAPVVAAGSVAGFSLVVTNSGPSDAEAVDIADLLPPEFVFVPAASDPACEPTIDPGSGTAYVRCQIGTVPAGGSRVVRVSGQIASDQLPGSLTNVVFAASQVVGGDFDLSNNQSEATIEVVSSADLVVTKMADTESQAVGELVTYTVAATNVGPSDAADVVLQDPLPEALEFVSAVGSDGVACAFDAGVVTCTTPTVVAGAAATATITVRLPVGLDPGEIINTASASTTTDDPSVENNTASATVNAFILADLAIEKSVVTQSPVAGEPVVFAFDVVNRGPQFAPRLVVSDSLPAGVTFASAVVPGGGACTVTNPEGIDIIRCEIGSLDVGATTRVLVTVATDPSLRSLTNGALVGSTAQDEASDDNYDEIAFALAEPAAEPTPTPTPTDGPPAPPAPDRPGALPATGGTAPLTAIGFGFLAIAFGLLLVELRRRRGGASR